jgi:hypothetical protein
VTGKNGQRRWKWPRMILIQNDPDVNQIRFQMEVNKIVDQLYGLTEPEKDEDFAEFKCCTTVLQIYTIDYKKQTKYPCTRKFEDT